MGSETNSDILHDLESWIAENGGFTLPKLYLSNGPRGRGVFLGEDVDVVDGSQEGLELCRLPSSLLITEKLAETSLSFGLELRQAAEEFSAAPGLLLLSAYLLHDHALEIAATDPFQRVSNEDGGGSHFAPYYRSLPVNHQMLPAQWPEQSLSERIKGSFLERQLRAKRHSLGLEFSLLQTYADAELRQRLGWEEFLWARCIVASRAYALQGQRCLVPWADLLNHGASQEVFARYQLPAGGRGICCELTYGLSPKNNLEM
eukprot:symbB.v1.2.017175.t1/scaffold1301.1/size126134/10